MAASVPWRDRCTTITETFTYMLEKEILVDAVFKTNEGCELFAHKMVLFLWSPFFAKLVAQMKETEILTIHVTQDIEVVEAVIKYLYSSECNKCFTKMPIDKLVQAIEFSKRYELMHVYKKCMQSFRRRNIYPKNVIEFFDYGLRENIHNVVHKCIKVCKFKGVRPTTSIEDVSLMTILNILKLDRIALRSEGELLNLAISWLSNSENEKHKYILSFVDLLSIEMKEYRSIIKKFPNFFTDSELSSIFLGMVHQDPKRFPEWFQPKIASVAKRSCSNCMSVCELKISKNLDFLKVIQPKDSTIFCLVFQFAFDCLQKAKLLKAELNFGPGEIPEKFFKVLFNKSGASLWKECSLQSTYSYHNYSVLFDEPVELHPGDSLTLKFNFQKSVKNKIHVVSPNVIQRQKLIKNTNKGVQVKIPYIIAFYVKENKIPKFLVSSFTFNLCEHDPYLRREHLKPNNIHFIEEDEPLAVQNATTCTNVKLEMDSNFFYENADFKMNSTPEVPRKDQDIEMNVITDDYFHHEDIKVNAITGDYQNFHHMNEDLKLNVNTTDDIRLRDEDQDFKMDIALNVKTEKETE